MTFTDHTFHALGTTVRVLVDAPDGPHRARAVEQLIREYDARLSRFRPDSELSRLNADPRAEVPASPLLRDAVSTALAAARASGGLVDPTLLGALERAGYVASWREEERPATTPRARRTAPARPHPDQRWRGIEVTGSAIRRPPGLRLDLGGTGKGHAADLAATRCLAGARRYALDAGGDIRIGGTEGSQSVEVEHTGRTLHIAQGAVATSAITRRAWQRPDGTSAHHLLDPATGEPAHTGVVQATATGRTAVEAETRAKVVLLSGRAAAAETLMADGGIVLVTDDGEVLAA